MLAYILAITIAVGSIAIYLAAFFFPEVHRKEDFIWSGVGLFYALVLWFCAGRITGAVLLGQTASVALLSWFGWQTLNLRREVTPAPMRTRIAEQKKVSAGISQLQERFTSLFKGKSKDKPEAKPVAATPVSAPTSESVAPAPVAASAADIVTPEPPPATVVPEVVSEPVPEAASEPVSEATPEATPEPTPEPASEPASESVATTSAKPVRAKPETKPAQGKVKTPPSKSKTPATTPATKSGGGLAKITAPVSGLILGLLGKFKKDKAQTPSTAKPKVDAPTSAPVAEVVPPVTEEVVSVAAPPVEMVPETVAETPPVEMAPETVAETPTVEMVPETVAETPTVEMVPETVVEGNSETPPEEDSQAARSKRLEPAIVATDKSPGEASSSPADPIE